MIEKPGMGDSQGVKDCSEIGYYEELEGLKQDKLLSYNFIDKNNIFIFGHSMGGTIEPCLAEEFNPKGVIVYGTTLKLYHDYLIDHCRVHGAANGIDYASIDDTLRSYRSTYFEYFYNKKSPKDIIMNAVHKKALVNGLKYNGNEQILNRHYTYWQELNEVNLYKFWKNTNSFVLSIYGESDLAALYPDSHKEIIKIVNHYHPNKGEFILLAETNHMMYKVGNMEELIKRRRQKDFEEYQLSRFNFELVEILPQWMKSKL